MISFFSNIIPWLILLFLLGVLWLTPVLLVWGSLKFFKKTEEFRFGEYGKYPANPQLPRDPFSGNPCDIFPERYCTASIPTASTMAAGPNAGKMAIRPILCSS